MLITEKKKIDDCYKALIERDQKFVGIFFVGVKTTSVFCIATCSARKPLLKNVLFYTNFKDALDNGFRPCKICKPTENAQSSPEQVDLAIKLVRENPKKKITDYQLKEKGISPDLIRRWFKKTYGMTFHAFQRMYRINNALIELKSGKKTTEAAFENGYESLSGFAYTFKKLIGQSPKNNKEQQVILINRLTSPIGPMFVCATEEGICLLEFVDRRMLETEFRDLQKLLNAKIIIGENQHIKQCKSEIEEYFKGKRKKFEVSLHSPGSQFQKLVWTGLLEIPFGQTSTYQKQAIALDKESAVRAIARANGFNRISIIVPCHRVIGSDGALKGYGGGLHRKQWLLDHEREHLI